MLEVLRDPNRKAESAKEAEKEELRRIYDGMFDQVELSRRILSRNRNSRTPPQREEFVGLFRQVLEKAYMDKILAYVDEQNTRFLRVISRDDRWKVHDVDIENVSLASNYRAQFDDILAKNTPEQMLEILRKKVKGLSVARSSGTSFRSDVGVGVTARETGTNCAGGYGNEQTCMRDGICGVPAALGGGVCSRGAARRDGEQPAGGHGHGREDRPRDP